jgi:glycosyltransferase involved in cell wall biosynthesis
MTLRRLLAVSHEATITGAPMNLLHLLGWIRDNTDIEVHTLIVRDGPMVGRFESVGEVTVLDRSVVSSALGLAETGLTRLGSTRAWRPVALARMAPQVRHLQGYDLAYFNSLTSITTAPYLPEVGVRVSHVHELQVAVRSWQPARQRTLFSTVPDRWIAASGAVRTMLCDELSIPADKVLLHHEFIDTRAVIDRSVGLREIEALRREVRIPHDAPIVMGAGTIDWRKGPDLFVQLATEVRRRTREPIAFVWLGGTLEGADWERLRSDVERSGADHVHFIGTRWDPMPWFHAADVFVLTSREDPYPLVALEHAALGHPIVSYRTGGIGELLEQAGPEAALGMVDHLDVGAMADRVIAFLSSDTQRAAAGRQLRSRVVSEHDVRVAAPRLVADLQRLVDRRA